MRLRTPEKVLLVEDHDDTREAVELLLQHHGYVVHSCNCSAAAIGLAAEERCDIALIDIGLPNIDGVELFKRLRAIRPTTAIALTAHVTAKELAAYRAVGFDDIVTKPFVIEDLLAAIRRLVAPATLAQHPGAEPAGADVTVHS